MYRYTVFTSPFCEVLLVGNPLGITHVHLDAGEVTQHFSIDSSWVRDDLFFKDIVQQFHAYFLGKRQDFDIPIQADGTPFQQRVWQELRKIPYGELRTYKDIAIAVSNPKAARAVGMANNKNPVPLIVPCHRVIGTNGNLTGFAPGLALKEKLIQLEQRYKTSF